MNVLMISPGFPGEMPFFTRGLKEVGNRVIGIGDQPEGALPEMARRHLDAYVQESRLWDEEACLRTVADIHRRVGLEAIHCVWEPGVLLAARLREELGIPGMTVAETVPFRDKEVMKRVLDDAGIRTPRHRRASSPEEVRAAAKAVGYPLIVKPIAGAGSADTHRVDDDAELERVLGLVGHVPVVSVEEFIEGEEFTFDTVCAGGEVLYENVSWYRPRPLIARTQHWISPQTLCLRRLDDERIAAGRDMGRAVLRALGFRAGFTHMEWFRKPDGEAVFGEIGCRPPGARSVDIMNFASDVDLFTGWAEAVTHGRLGQTVRRRYNSAVVFKRAEGEGRISSIRGLDGLLAEFGPHVAAIDLLPPGAPRRNWKQTLLSDGHVIVRHPDLQFLCHMADEIGMRLRLTAG
jgi:biotin carboxylase